MTLAWDPSPAAEVAGYRLSYGTESGSYTHHIDVGPQTTYTLSDLDRTLTYYFSVRAYSVEGVVGGASNEVMLAAPPPSANLQAPSVVASSADDLDDDGRADFLWQDTVAGWLAVWRLQNGQLLGGLPLTVTREPDLDWHVAGSADFDRDGKLDVLWRHQRTGRLRVWYMDRGTVLRVEHLSHSVPDVRWRVAGLADFDGDGWTDILWHEQQAGWLAVWRLQQVTLLGGTPLSVNRVADTAWQIVSVRDFSGDGKADVLWHHRSEGWLAFWRMEGPVVAGSIPLSHNRVADTQWKAIAAADLNGDGHPDIIWRHTDGRLATWALRHGALLGGVTLSHNRVEPSWKLVLPH